MKIKVDSVNINVEVFSEFDNKNDFLFLLHGFTGSANDWVEVADHLNKKINVIAIDLIGHGKSDSPTESKHYSPVAHTKQIKAVINHFTSNKVFLLGYSMGGRAALNFAINNPQMLKGLILESTSAGIDNEDERDKRIESDNELSEFIETHSIEEFVDLWLEKDIFSSLKNLPEAKLHDLKIARLKNSKIGLANSLRGFGTSVMPYLTHKLSEINFPVLLLSGQLDSKFTNINNSLSKKFSNAKHSVIKTAGHNTHLEKPKYFLQSVNEFLQKK